METSKKECNIEKVERDNEFTSVHYGYFQLSPKEKRNFTRLGIHPVQLSESAIKKLDRQAVGIIAHYEKCCIKTIKSLLKKNELGGQLTRIEVLLIIAELTDLSLDEIVNQSQEGYMVICIKKINQ